jgi:hypothetical protein
LIGLAAFVVTLCGALTQFTVGRMIDRNTLKRVFLPVSIVLAIAGLKHDLPLSDDTRGGGAEPSRLRQAGSTAAGRPAERRIPHGGRSTGDADQSAPRPNVGRRADVEVYLRRASGLDLSDDHFTRAQRPATIITRRAQLRMFATAIVKSGIAADTLVESPDDPDGPRGHQHDDCPLCRGRERHGGAPLCSNQSSDSRAAVTRKSTSVARLTPPDGITGWWKRSAAGAKPRRAR